MHHMFLQFCNTFFAHLAQPPMNPTTHTAYLDRNAFSPCWITSPLLLFRDPSFRGNWKRKPSRNVDASTKELQIDTRCLKESGQGGMTRNTMTGTFVNKLKA